MYGKDDDDHDKYLHVVLRPLEERGLTVNIRKCRFGKSEMDYFGWNFSSESIRLKQANAEALLNAKSPTNTKELRNFLGLVNYCAKFIPDLATLLAPFCEFTKARIRWYWNSEQEKAFNRLKSKLTLFLRVSTLKKCTS